MPRNVSFWLVIQSLYKVGDIIAVTFVNFYIYETLKSLDAVLIYNAYLFVILPIAVLTAGIILRFTHIKFIYSIGLSFYIIQMMILFSIHDQLKNYLQLLGIVSGIAIGFQAFGNNLVSQTFKIKDGGLEKFFAYRSSIMSIIQMFIPFICTLLIIKFSYNALFAISALIFIIAIILTILSSISNIKDNANIIELVTKNINPDLKNFLIIKFLNGIDSGISWSLIGIIILSISGKLIYWSMITTTLTIITIFGSILILKFIKEKTAAVGNIIFAYTYAAFTIIFAANYDLLYLIFYLLSKTILNILVSIQSDPILYRMTEQDQNIENNRTKYQILSEFALNAGRLIPTLILIYYKVYLTNEITLRIVLLSTAIIPFLVMQIIYKSHYMKKNSLYRI